MTRSISFITIVGAALALAAPALGDNWGADRSPQSPYLSPDVVDRAVAAEQARQSSMLDARERSLQTRPDAGPSALEAREQAFGAKRQAQLASTSGPDAFERAANATTTQPAPGPVVDDRFRIDPSSSPVPVATASGREIEWPQVGIGVGIGLGIGLLLGLCLLFGVRHARIRTLAH